MAEPESNGPFSNRRLSLIIITIGMVFLAGYPVTAMAPQAPILPINYDSGSFPITLSSLTGEVSQVVTFDKPFAGTPFATGSQNSIDPFVALFTANYILYKNQTSNSALQLPPVVVGVTPTVMIPNAQQYVVFGCGIISIVGPACPVNSALLMVNVRLMGAGQVVTCWLQAFDNVLGYYVDWGSTAKTPSVTISAVGLSSGTVQPLNETLIQGDDADTAYKVQMVCTVPSGTRTVRFDFVSFDVFAPQLSLTIKAQNTSPTQTTIVVDYNIALVNVAITVSWDAKACPTGIPPC